MESSCYVNVPLGPPSSFRRFCTPKTAAVVLITGLVSVVFGVIGLRNILSMPTKLAWSFTIGGGSISAAAIVACAVNHKIFPYRKPDELVGAQPVEPPRELAELVSAQQAKPPIGLAELVSAQQAKPPRGLAELVSAQQVKHPRALEEQVSAQPVEPPIGLAELVSAQQVELLDEPPPSHFGHFKIASTYTNFLLKLLQEPLVTPKAKFGRSNFTTLSTRHILSNIPTTEEKTVTFYNFIETLGPCVVVTVGTPNMPYLKQHIIKEAVYAPPHTKYVYTTTGVSANGGPLLPSTHIWIPFDTILSLVIGCQFLLEAMEQGQQLVFVCPDGESENTTLLACHLIYSLSHFCQPVVVKDVIARIMFEYPQAKPNFEMIGEFANFLNSLNPKVKRWYFAGLVFPSISFYPHLEDTKLIEEFSQVTWRETSSVDIRRENRTRDSDWKDRSRFIGCVPFEGNQFNLSTGEVFNASVLPFGFIATQTPIHFKTEVNKFETVTAYLKMLEESGTHVVVAIGVNEDDPPPCSGVRVVRLDGWRNKQAYDIDRICEAIKEVENYRKDLPVVVMCGNGSTLTCTYIACHLAYEIYHDTRGEGLQLSLRKLHELLRLPPFGRYAAINFTDHYRFVDRFIQSL